MALWLYRLMVSFGSEQQWNLDSGNSNSIPHCFIGRAYNTLTLSVGVCVISIKWILKHIILESIKSKITVIVTCGRDTSIKDIL